jgi:hypothetical protein
MSTTDIPGVNPENEPRPQLLDNLEDAAKEASNKLLDNYENYVRHLRPDFGAYFMLGDDLHALQRERLVAGLGLREFPGRDDLKVTVDGVVLQVLFNLDDELIPYDVTYRAVQRPPIPGSSSLEA